MTPTDNKVEDEADENPGNVVEWRRWWHVARAREHEGEIDVFEELHSELLLQYPLERRSKRTDQEKEDEAVIETTMGEQMLWSDHAPLLSPQS